MDKEQEIQKLKEQLSFYEKKLAEYQSVYYQHNTLASFLRYLAYQLEAAGLWGLIKKALNPAKLLNFLKFLSAKRK